MTTKNLQEQCSKCRNTLGGLEISILHQTVNTLELSAPPPPPEKKTFILVISRVKFQTTNTCSIQKMVALYSCTVKQSSDLKTYSIKVSPMSLEAWLSSLSLVLWLLFSWYRSFAMCIRTYIHDSVAFPVLLLMDIEDPHHYWNVVYR